MLVALKIDLLVADEIPRLVPPLRKLLDDYRLKATFFPALSRESASGAFVRWLSKTGFLSESARAALLDLREQGHEIGALPLQPALWRSEIQSRDADWSRRQIEAGLRAYRELFQDRPRGFSAVDYSLNADVAWLESELGLDYAVDTRGLHPYLPMTPNGPSKCPQIPVTLPRIEDMLAAGEALGDMHQSLFMESQKPLLPGHVFSFTAAHPGHLDVLEKLIVMWMGSQRKLVTLREMLEEVETDRLGYHHIGMLRRDRHAPYQAVQAEPVEIE